MEIKKKRLGLLKCDLDRFSCFATGMGVYRVKVLKGSWRGRAFPLRGPRSRECLLEATSRIEISASRAIGAALHSTKSKSERAMSPPVEGIRPTLPTTWLRGRNTATIASLRKEERLASRRSRRDHRRSQLPAQQRPPSYSPSRAGQRWLTRRKATRRRALPAEAAGEETCCATTA